jgi:hypothetical protein
LALDPGAASGSTRLTLTNGWTAAKGAVKPSISLSNGIVTFKGAVANGSEDDVVFVLPQAFRATADVFMRVALCKGQNGRLYIYASDGTAFIQADTDFTGAQCLTSFDGASFALSPDSFQSLTLNAGWVATGRQPAFRSIGGVVHFQGAMYSTGNNTVAFTLPPNDRPAADVYIPLDLCAATNGRLHITPDGNAEVQDSSDTYSGAKCFVSLDGAQFTAASAGYTPLTLLNGWTNAPYSTRNAAAKLIGGVVHFAGAIGSGAKATAFVLPPAFRPAKNVYVAVDLSSTHGGRLHISPDGTVTVQSQDGFFYANDFTSLEGVTFHR